MPRLPATLCLFFCIAATTKPTTRPAMDYGPFLSYSVIDGEKSKKDLALKGINIKLDNNHTICFDTDLLRYAAAWQGGFLDLGKTHQIELKGSLPPSVAGQIVFSTEAKPGVSPTDNFDDPRPDKMGPLPRDFAQYKGLYIHGQQVILSYTIGDAQVLELPAIINKRPV